MNKKKYAELLKTDEWKKKRKSVLKRDGYQCNKCSSKDKIQVHHRYYINGRMPWEYPDSVLVSLCNKCHILEHKNEKIVGYNEKDVKNAEKKNKKKILIEILQKIERNTL